MITDEMVEAGLRAWYPPGVWDDTVKSDDPVVPKEREDMRLALEAAEAAAWRGIESVPKDAWILVWYPSSLPRMVAWQKLPDDSEGCWIEGAAGFCTKLHASPTHWRPLPAPPREPPT